MTPIIGIITLIWEKCGINSTKTRLFCVNFIKGTARSQRTQYFWLFRDPSEVGALMPIVKKIWQKFTGHPESASARNYQSTSNTSEGYEKALRRRERENDHFSNEYSSFWEKWWMEERIKTMRSLWMWKSKHSCWMPYQGLRLNEKIYIHKINE